jgi:hypothetical protein
LFETLVESRQKDRPILGLVLLGDAFGQERETKGEQLEKEVGIQQHV